MNARRVFAGLNVVVMVLVSASLAGCTTSHIYKKYGDRPAGRQHSVAKSTSHGAWAARKAAQRQVAVRPIPAGGVVVVRKGDTVYGLARRYGAPLREIIALNHLRAPFRLAIGQKIRLPRPRFHVVRRGETSYAISRRYGVELTTLIRLNHIRRPYVLKVGQKLRLPARWKPAARRATPVKSARTAKSTRPVKSARVTPPPARANIRFAWPIRGRIISHFGPKKGGLHNDGINIAARTGAPVRAAEAGVVVYAGNALRSFGNLLLIRHASGWITAYAHNQTIVVRVGQSVKKGQIVARAGATGKVKTAQLHFEIRKGKNAVNPQKYL